MARSDQDWRIRTAHFYEALYACVWRNLETLLGAPATLDLVTLSRNALRQRYPFLSRLAWSVQGLQPGSMEKAIAGEEREQVHAGCERFLQGVHTVVREIGGDALAQRLAAATERQRGALEGGNDSRPAAEEADAAPCTASKLRSTKASTSRGASASRASGASCTTAAAAPARPTEWRVDMVPMPLDSAVKTE